MDLIQRFQQSLTEYNRARRLIDEGRINQAESLLRNALSLYPREILMRSDPGLDGMVRESYETLFTDISVQLEVIKTLRSDKTVSETPYPAARTETAAPPGIETAAPSFTTLQDIVRRNIKRGSTPPPTFIPGERDEMESPPPASTGKTETEPPLRLSDRDEENQIEETLKTDFSAGQPRKQDAGGPAVTATILEDIFDEAETEAGATGFLGEAEEEPAKEPPPAPETPARQAAAGEETEPDTGDILEDLLADAGKTSDETPATAQEEAPAAEAGKTATPDSKGDVEDVDQEPIKQDEEVLDDGLEEILKAAEEEESAEAATPAARPPAPAAAGPNEEVLDDEEEALIPAEDLDDNESGKNKKEKKEKKEKKKRERKPGRKKSKINSGAAMIAAANVLLGLAALGALAGGGYLMFDAYTKGSALQTAYAAAGNAVAEGKSAALINNSEAYFRGAKGASANANNGYIAAAWGAALEGKPDLDQADALLTSRFTQDPSSQAVAEQLLDVLFAKLDQAAAAGTLVSADRDSARILQILNMDAVNPARKQTLMKRLAEKSCAARIQAARAAIEAGDPAAAHGDIMQLESLEAYLDADQKADLAGMALSAARALEKKADEALKAGNAAAAAELAGKALELNAGPGAARIRKLAEAKLK